MTLGINEYDFFCFTSFIKIKTVSSAIVIAITPITAIPPIFPHGSKNSRAASTPAFSAPVTDMASRLAASRLSVMKRLPPMRPLIVR